MELGNAENAICTLKLHLCTAKAFSLADAIPLPTYATDLVPNVTKERAVTYFYDNIYDSSRHVTSINKINNTNYK